MTWLSIDGGNEAKTDRACYVASWRLAALLGVDEVNLHVAQCIAAGGEPRPACVVVERHQQDGRISGGGGKVPPGVVIDLAWNTAAVAYTLARGAPVHEYTPNDWIGGLNKAMLQRRIWSALTPGERVLVASRGRAELGPRKRGDAYSGRPVDVTSALVRNAKRAALGQDLLKHDWYNILDAVGVGLFHLGRVGKGPAPLRTARSTASR